MANESHPRGVKKVRRACKHCQRKKIKCDGYYPCSSCLSAFKDCFYEGATAPIRKPQQHAIKVQMLKELDIAADAFAKLKSFSSFNNASMQVDLSMIEKNMKKYKEELGLKPDVGSFNSYCGSDSVEKILVDQEYITLGKFRSVSLLGDDEIFSTYHGLYNPTSLESSDGFAWMLKQLNMKEKESKSTVFYFLKYLDLATKHYFSLLNIQTCPSKLLESEFPDLISESTHDSVCFVIRTLLEMTSNSSNEIDFPTPGQSGKLLQLVGETASHLHGWPRLKSCNSVGGNLTCSQDKLLLASGCACLMSCLLSGAHDTNIIKGIFSFLEAMHWQMEQHTIGRFVTVAVRFCLDLGLNRWEFYLDQKEIQADEYRKMWWSCLWWDRWYSLLTGKPFLIIEQFAICLFPRCLSDLGARETMEAEELLPYLDRMTSNADAVLSSRIFISKVITRIFKKIAYNRKFTDISLLSNDFENTSSVLMELLQEQKAITSILERYEAEYDEKFSANDHSQTDHSLLLSYAYTHVMCFSVTENVILRLKDMANENIKKEMDIGLSTIRRQSSTVCERLLRHFLKLDEPYHIYLFSFPLNSLMVNIASNFLEQQMQRSSYILTILCRVAKAFHDLQTSSKSADGTADDCLEVFDLICFRAYLIVRICIQIYLSNSEVRKEVLIEDISEIDTAASEMCSKLSNCHFSLFDPLIRTAEVSNFHRVLAQKFGKEIGPNFDETIEKHTNANIGDLSPDSNELSHERISFSLEELETFLNLDFSFEDLTDLWTSNNN